MCVENEKTRRMRSLRKSKLPETGELVDVRVGEKIVVRGEEYLVVEIEQNPYTPHSMPQLIVDKPFCFSGWNVPVRVLSSVEVRCQFGLVPEAHILDFEPVTVDFSPKHTNCGRLTVTFSTISFNLSLSSHRNPFAFCTGLSH